MIRNFFRKAPIILSVILISIFLCSCTPSDDIKGTYIIDSVIPVTNTKNITEETFNDYIDRHFEFRIEENNKATVSYIFFTNTYGDGIYALHVANNIVTYRTSGDTLILEGSTLGDGSLDISIKDGWILLSYKIENELIYIAKYKKNT